VATIKVIEVISSSPHGFQQAVEAALQESAKTIRDIVGIQVVGWTCKVENGRICDYRTDCKVAFKVEGDRV
jgi:hypothetical protein